MPKGDEMENARIKEFKGLMLVPGTIVRIAVAHIRPNPDQPRKFFRDEDLTVLASSFEGRDVDCPIHVTMRDTHVLIIDGERRYRAALKAGLTRVSCQVFNKLDDKKVFLRSARGNFGRKDMSPVEVARTIKKLMDDHGWNQTDAARWASMHPTQVSQVLKYLNLSPQIQELLIRGEISNGMALIVACYPRANQLAILEGIIEARNKLGGKIDQNAVLRAAKAVAERQGCSPCDPKRGKKATLSHTDAVIKNVLSKTAALEKALDEMFAAERAAGGSEKFFKQLKNTNILEVERCLKDLEKKLRQGVQRISSAT